MRFNSKSLIFFFPKEGFRNFSNDWIEVESLDFYPWYNILSFLKFDEKGTILEEIGETEITNWLSTINDPIFDYPYVNVIRGHIEFIILGKPRSIRSQRGKYRLTKEVESKKEEIVKLYPQPFAGNVEMKVEIFLEDVNSNDRPDIDRLTSLITDAFEGIAYVDDKQIRSLSPKIIDVSQAFTKLECRTDPMGHFSLEDIPIGSIFPLSMGIKNYYVVRINYYA